MYTTYGKVNSFLLSVIPEFRERYKEEMQKRGKHPKQYITFAALISMVLPALDFGYEPGLLARAFDAVEEMARSDDREVVNLLQVGFVQDLVRYPKRLAIAWERMGPETRRLTTDTARAWNREMNLPAAARDGEKSKAKAHVQGR
jgi:hypothetical protein